MGAAIRCLFSDQVAAGGPRAGNTSMTWAFSGGSGGHAPITSRNLSVVALEDQAEGQLANEWSLDCSVGGGVCSPCAAPSVGIGHKRINGVID